MEKVIAGVASNYNEALIWDATTIDPINGEQDQQYLCEVYENLSGLIVIAERIDRLTELEFDGMSSFYRAKLYGLIPDKSELNHHIVGKVEVDGMIRYKLLDYGTNILIKSYKKGIVLRYLKILREEFGLNP